VENGKTMADSLVAEELPMNESQNSGSARHLCLFNLHVLNKSLE